MFYNENSWFGKFIDWYYENCLVKHWWIGLILIPLLEYWLLDKIFS